MSSRGKRRYGPWTGPALLFLAYLAAAKAGLAMDPVGGFATLVWLPTGIAIASLFRWGTGLWPGVALGAFLANWTSGAPAAAAAGIAAGNTLEAVVAVLLLRHFFGFRAALERVRDVISLFLAAGAAVVLSASLGAASLWMSGILKEAQAGPVWRAWAVGDLLGALTVAPLILTWGAPSRRRTDWRPALEEAAFILCLAAVNGLLFLPPFDGDPRHFLSAYLLSIPLFWAALRFHPSGAAATILATQLFAIWGTSLGGGPFAQGPLNESLLFLQIFTGTIAASTLLLAAATAERQRAFREVQLSEERLRRSHRAMEDSNRRLESSLREKETLLREVHHRVKNNLQTVHSLLCLQAGRVGNPEVLADLQDCRERVMSMSLVHEKLYRSPDLARIDFAEYIRDLTRHLVRSLGDKDGKVRVDVRAEPIALDVQEAMPCGLVLYELVSNALKHAFTAGREGTILVSLSRMPDGRAELSVEDDGVGLPEGMDLDKGASLGLHLVKTLTGQLDGTLKLESGGGTKFRILFPTGEGAGGATSAPKPEVLGAQTAAI